MEPRLPTSGYILGLDVGEKRIGTAVSSAIARLPQPSVTVRMSEKAVAEILQLASREGVVQIVVGLPRNMEGGETAQSRTVREFADLLAAHTKLPIVFADESLSSARADEIMKNNTFKNASQDSLAACFILEEYFASNAKDIKERE
jgi:putative holliday junction resolvase